MSKNGWRRGRRRSYDTVDTIARRSRPLRSQHCWGHHHRHGEWVTVGRTDHDGDSAGIVQRMK